MDCHEHPASKSRDKAKGSHKLRSKNVNVWPSVDGYRGHAASGMLALLCGSCEDAEIEDEKELDHIVGVHTAQFEGTSSIPNDGHELDEIGSAPSESEDELNQNEMEFYDVGAVLGLVDDVEDWCLVGECSS